MNIRTLGTVILLILFLFTGFLIRIQVTPHIPEGQLTGTDAYLYYWQAQIVSEHGKLPERDMHRWLPLGRDLGQTLNFYSYTLAYAHKAVAFLLPKVTLYQVVLYAPAVCFCIGLGILYLFLTRAFGLLVSSIVAVFLVTMPGSIERSTAGFGDRDAWCLMIGILAVVTYLLSVQTRKTRNRFLWTLASGFSVFLGGISWEGFGVFLSVILLIELWQFLTSEAEDGLGIYFLWVCLFVPTLYLASPAYRGGHGFATHLSVFMLVPPVVLLGIRALRHLLLTKTRWADTLKPHARALAFGLTLTSIVFALGYIFIQRNTFASTTVPLSRNALMQSVGELKDPIFIFWLVRYGSVFVFGALGILMAVIRFWKRDGVLFAVSIALFTLTAFYRSLLDGLLGFAIGNLLFGAALAICALGLLTLAWRKQYVPEKEPTYIAFMLWFLFWVALTRDARRYDFFIGVSVAFFTADLLRFVADFYGNEIKSRVPQVLLKTAIIGITLTLILFWTPVGGHANRTLIAATKMRQPIPGRGDLAKTLDWIKAELPPTSVVAGTWNYGSVINVLGGVKTIIDQDHYIQHWIHLYNRYVHCGNTLREALEFLKTHEATHLMLEGQDTIFNADDYSHFGSDENGDRRFTITPLQKEESKDMENYLVPAPHANIPLESIKVDMVDGSGLTVKAQLKTGEFISLPAVALINKGRVTAEAKNEYGGLLLVFNESQDLAAAYYIPFMGWDSLAVRLYFRGDIPDIFVPLYPTDRNAAANVKIWEIHYPPDIQPNPKYLATEPEK